MSQRSNYWQCLVSESTWQLLLINSILIQTYFVKNKVLKAATPGKEWLVLTSCCFKRNDDPPPFSHFSIDFSHAWVMGHSRAFGGFQRVQTYSRRRISISLSHNAWGKDKWIFIVAISPIRLKIDLHVCVRIIIIKTDWGTDRQTDRQTVWQTDWQTLQLQVNTQIS